MGLLWKERIRSQWIYSKKKEFAPKGSTPKRKNLLPRGLLQKETICSQGVYSKKKQFAPKGSTQKRNNLLPVFNIRVDTF